MAKPPPNLPSVGDRAKWRGKDATGTVKAIGEGNWTQVEWDWHHRAPQVVHLHELEKI